MVDVGEGAPMWECDSGAAAGSAHGGFTTRQVLFETMGGVRSIGWDGQVAGEKTSWQI